MRIMRLRDGAEPRSTSTETGGRLGPDWVAAIDRTTRADTVPDHATA